MKGVSLNPFLYMKLNKKKMLGMWFFRHNSMGETSWEAEIQM